MADFKDVAKQLARDAGYDDPLTIVNRVNEKPCPAWTLFINAAREQLAREEAARNPHINKQPQAEEYQGATFSIVGEHEPNTVAQLMNCMRVGNVVSGAICADGHLGYAQPVGAAIAYEDHISVSGVGYDIGCGNMAVKLDTQWKDISWRAGVLGMQIARAISFGVGRVNDTPVEHELFDDTDAWKAADVENLKDMARQQLGTVGSGNHYVDVFEDEQGAVWIGVHFGSRGLGHKSATKYLKAAGGEDGINVAPAIVDERTELGSRYLSAMELAGRYAYAGREWVVERVRQIVGGTVIGMVHNHHNFAWKENHGGRDLWVVRKGCTPAFPGQRGFVGGSMGDNAVILQGAKPTEPSFNFMQQSLLYSTVHGAGRTFGRMAAKRTFTRAQMEEWLKDKGVFLVGGDVDESPMAYRRLTEVLAAHEGTIDVLHTLQPRIVVMAGDDIVDPYKD